MIDFGALMPEINSARMYAGPGSAPMLAAAAAWEELAAELSSAASSYRSVISGLTSGPWLGPSALAMAAAATPYVAWMSATAGQAQVAAAQAQAAAGAFETAFAMTVPPPLIAANRAQLMMLVATNFFRQNTPAIAATEAEYGEMWAQDAAAMYGYAGNSSAITAQVTPFTSAPQTTNPAGLAAQGTQSAGTSTGAGAQSTLSHLVSTVPAALQSLASPSLASSSTSESSGVLSGLLGGASSVSSTTEGLSSALSNALPGFSLGGVASSAVSNYATIPGWFALYTAGGALGPVLASYGAPLNAALMNAAAAAPAAGAAAGAAGAAAQGALGAGFGGAVGGYAGLGGLAALGQASSLSGLSVPSTWGWAAAGPAGMLGKMPLVLPGTGFGTGPGLPIIFGGIPHGAAPAAAPAAASGTNAAKYGPRLNVVARPPAAGYSPVPESPVDQRFPVPGGLPPAAAGYTPAIV